MTAVRPEPVYVVTKDWEGRTLTATPRRDIALALPLEVPSPGETRIYQMTFPFLPPSKNVYDNWQWMAQRSAKLKWLKAIVRECEAQAMPKNLPRIGLGAVLVFPSRVQRRDVQNYAQTLWHFVPDALQAPSTRQLAIHAKDPSYTLPYGLIPDDTDGRIDWPPGLGVRFEYDERKHVPKERRQRTMLAISMRVPS